MVISTRARFILISVGITVLALLLFTSVVYERAIKYKHQQEVGAYRILADEFFRIVYKNDDLNIIKQYILENINTEIQPAKIFALIDTQHNVDFYYSRHDLKEGTLENILLKIKGSLSLGEGQTIENNTLYSWFMSDLFEKGNKSYSLLVIYPLTSSIKSEFIKFFGFPFIVSGLLMCWLMVWASIILSSLVSKLEKHKQVLSSQTADIEKARDEALRANSAKSYFLANMSHEIRTPLTSIIGFAESCLDINQSIKERSKATKTIIKNGKHLMHIINEILDLSKIESGKFELEMMPISILQVVEEINELISIMAEEKGLVFKINYSYPLPDKIISDPVRLKQILINLCSNAVKFTHKGYVQLNISYAPESLTLIFEVVDTGIGISAKQKEKIFNSFEQADSSTTREFGGTGLGLTLSKKLVAMLNGEISVESVVSKGSHFTVKLKIAEVEDSSYIYQEIIEHSEEKMNGQNSEVPKLKGKVLLAEDNEDIQNLVKLLISKIGIELDIVENGQQAVKAAIESDYDLILMDIQMPVMDGFTALQKLKEQNYNSPVIAMTANAMQKDRDECKKAGFVGFISKPINRNNLYSLLMQYLAASKTVKGEEIVLTSGLLDDDPALIDLIDKFLARLPIMRDAINKAYVTQNEEELIGLIHQMKGVGGGYGYPVLTELCAKIEFQVASNHADNVNALMEEFNLLIDRILAGNDENHKIAEANK